TLHACLSVSAHFEILLIAAAATPATATAATATAAAPAALAVLRFVDLERSAIQIAAVEGSDGRLGIRGARHLPACESAGLAGLAIGDDLDFGPPAALLLAHFAQRGLSGLVRKISNIQSRSGHRRLLEEVFKKGDCFGRKSR